MTGAGSAAVGGEEASGVEAAAAAAGGAGAGAGAGDANDSEQRDGETDKERGRKGFDYSPIQMAAFITEGFMCKVEEGIAHARLVCLF